MPFLSHPVRRRVFGLLMVAVSGLALQAVTASAKTTPAAAPFKLILRGTVAATPVAPPPLTLTKATPEPLLKHLPASRDELTMRGENAVRAFTVMLGQAEAARIGVFQMSLLNAISVLPEHSSVKVTVNGTVVTSLHPDSSIRPTRIAIQIPPGVLVAGANTVQITTAFSHRVDCSVPATYELWATLDPAQTGFVVARDDDIAVRSIDDLALEPLAADGTTRIHLRMADNPSAEDISRAARVVNDLARRNGLPRPIVDVGPLREMGMGINLIITQDGRTEEVLQGLSLVASGEGVTLARDRLTNRLVVIVTDADRAVPLKSPLATGRAGRGLPGATQESFNKTFAQLGLPTEVFTGRHYASTIDVALPPDFLASNDRARVLLDGSHSDALSPGAALMFRVNGTFISSLQLAAGRSEQFQHTIVELPLRFFHPGHNDLSIEGVTTAKADAVCDAMTTPTARLTIADTSELQFPRFVHIAAIPQISAAMAYDAATKDVHLYLPGADQRSIGAGLTMLANLSVNEEQIGNPRIHIGMPDEAATPGIVIGAKGDLPPGLAAGIGRLMVSGDAAGQGATASDSPFVNGGGTAEASAGFPRMTPKGAPMQEPSGLAGVAAEGLSTVQALLRRNGFFFATGERSDPLPPIRKALTVAAVAQKSDAPSLGSIALSTVTQDPTHWLIVTAADREIVASALETLVAKGRWAGLSGEAASFDPATTALRTLQPRTVSYVLPTNLILADLRPILADVMTNNIVVSVAMLLALMAVLGVSTHVVIRRMGVK